MTYRWTLLTLTLVSLLAFPSVVFSQWTEDYRLAPDRAAAKAEGAYKVMLLVVDDYEALVHEWNNPSMPTGEPSIYTATTVERGGSISSVILFEGCRPDINGNCNLEVDYTVRYPNRAIHSEERGVILWKSTVLDPKRLYWDAPYHVAFDSGDPLGRYMVEAVVHDRVWKTKIELEYEFELVQTPVDETSNTGLPLDERPQ